MEKVRILVVGKNNVGKTTIAHFIKEALKEAGFKDVAISDVEDSKFKDPVTERMKRNIERPVSIEVVTIGRISLEEAKVLSDLKVR